VVVVVVVKMRSGLSMVIALKSGIISFFGQIGQMNIHPILEIPTWRLFNKGKIKPEIPYGYDVTGDELFLVR
jgi:hypothetical protein